MEKRIDMILTALSEFRSDFIEFKKENQEQLTRIEEAVLRLEADQPKDIMAVLSQINNKLDDRDSELQVLNKRLFKTESEIERLTRQ
jgi:archaellum component FlaC